MRVMGASDRSRQRRYGAALSYGVMILQFLIAMFYTPYLVGALGKSEYGIYMLVASLVGFTNLLSLGLGGSYVRFFSQFVARDDTAGLAGLNRFFLHFYVSVAAIVFIVGLIIVARPSSVFGTVLTSSDLTLASALVLPMILGVCATLVATPFISFIMAHEQYVLQKMVAIFQVVALPCLGALMLYFGVGAIGLSWMTFAVTAISASYLSWHALARLGMELRGRALGREQRRKVFSYSGWIWINMIITQVNYDIDKLILGRVRGAPDVAVYAIASQFTSLYISLSTAIAGVFTSHVHRIAFLVEGDARLSEVFNKVARVQLVVMLLVLVGFMGMGKAFLLVWVGPQFEDAFWVVVIMLIALTVPLAQNVGIEIQRAKNLHAFRTLLYLGLAVGNVALSIPLARALGPIGAAAGTALTLIAGNVVVMNWYYASRVGLDIRMFWRLLGELCLKVSPVAVLVACISAFASLNSIFAVLTWSAVTAAAYSVVAVRLIATVEERQKLWRFLRHLALGAAR